MLDAVENSSCLDCKDIIDGMVFKYEGCVERVAQQTAVINSYHNVITNGLQQNINKLTEDMAELKTKYAGKLGSKFIRVAGFTESSVTSIYIF